jgi:hypothetical protein
VGAAVAVLRGTGSAFFFLGGRRGTRTLKHFVNLTGESKNFKKMFLSQTESTPKHFVNLTGESKNFFKMFLSQTESTLKHFVNLTGESKNF